MNALKLLPVIAFATQATLFSSAVRAEASDCFPLCEQTALQSAAASKEAPRLIQCDNQLVRQAESINVRIKPIKEIAGYVRSPQGLAIKLVNDHVFKIPAWVGYAADPVGSLKNRAVGEVKSQLRETVMPAAACADPRNEETGSEPATVDNWDLLAV